LGVTVTNHPSRNDRTVIAEETLLLIGAVRTIGKTIADIGGRDHLIAIAAKHAFILIENASIEALDRGAIRDAVAKKSSGNQRWKIRIVKAAHVLTIGFVFTAKAFDDSIANGVPRDGIGAADRPRRTAIAWTIVSPRPFIAIGRIAAEVHRTSHFVWTIRVGFTGEDPLGDRDAGREEESELQG